MTLPVTPRIYVASLSDYNAGRLHGVWIDLEGKDSEDVWEEINAMLRASSEPIAEEWAIHDYEGFAPMTLSEYESINDIVKLVDAVEEHGQALLAWVAQEPTYRIEALDSFPDAYAGEWRSVEEWAEEFLEDTGALAEIPDSLRAYFDVEKYARDCDLSGDIETVDSDNGVYVFWTNY